MNFEAQLKNYAKLLVSHGLNVQEGQILNISAESINRDFALLVAEAAYARGAKYVNLDLADARLVRLRVLSKGMEDLRYVPSYLSVKYDELLDTTAANLKILGSEDPDLLADLDPKKMNTMLIEQRLALKRFYDDGIGKSKVHWTVAAAATPKWGARIFPKLSEKEAYARLWQEILKAVRADKENCTDLWKTHNVALHSRAKKFTELKIKELHFKGPGTDLIVGLSTRAVFKGGTDVSPRGVEFEPNIPTEEVFTTPDFRETNGRVKTTRPFLINGRLIKNLELEFKNGEIVSFSASEGEETFREYISSDEGAKRLGEVALVGVDSPIYQSGIIFEEILFDENAACHIAIGMAYKFCLSGGPEMSKEGLESYGCNESSVHTDMMISSKKVDVLARTYSGEEIVLISKGSWCPDFK